MTLARKTLVTIAALLALMAAAEAQVATITAADMTFFYKNPSPERVTQLIRFFNGTVQPDNPGAQPPVIGFLAAAFRRYPAEIDTMIPDGSSTTLQGVVATALRLAGQDAKAQAVVDRLKAAGAAAPDLRYVPTSLDAVQATGPSEFDLFWGASFATGDPRFVTKILAHFAAVADVDGNADDMVAVVRNFGTGADLHWVVQKRGADKARQLIEQSTALWALSSNATQHDFVRVAIGTYLQSHPATPAAKALQALAQAYGRYDVTKVLSRSNGAPRPTATVNIGAFSQVLNDLDRHAGAYPPHFEFPDDQQRAQSDTSAIASLLDPLLSDFSQSAPILMRLARLHVIGFNLDIEGSFDKANAAFLAWIRLTPEDPQANFQYGAFLASVTHSGEGIPHLQKAKSLGVVDADYWLGLSYVTLRDKPKAVAELELFTKNVPSDQKAAALLDAVRHDKVKLEEHKSPAD